MRAPSASLRDLASEAAARLAAAGIGLDEARLDAALLARHVLGWDRATWITREREAPPAAFAAAFADLVARRARREPMGYVLGRAEFWDLEFELGPGVLVPRPETELVVEETLARAPVRDAAWRVADVGTGSGCLAVALARELPAARVVAIDLSREALALAGRNARRHGVEARVALVRGSLLSATSGPFDAIVSNPPYVPEPDGPRLPPEVREHEPPVALYGGADGLTLIRRLVAQARPRLRPGGWMIFEFGMGQAADVRALLEAGGWASIALRPDLQGIPRTAVARRPPNDA